MRSSRSASSSSRCGWITRQGPHQGAQKSTSTGESDSITSAWKLVSVTSASDPATLGSFGIAVYYFIKYSDLPNVTSALRAGRIRCLADREPTRADPRHNRRRDRRLRRDRRRSSRVSWRRAATTSRWWPGGRIASTSSRPSCSATTGSLSRSSHATWPTPRRARALLELIQAPGRRTISALCNNAGLGSFGLFWELDPERRDAAGRGERRRAPPPLRGAAARDGRARRGRDPQRGLARGQPATAEQQTYAATKAFVNSFSEGAPCRAVGNRGVLHGAVSGARQDRVRRCRRDERVRRGGPGLPVGERRRRWPRRASTGWTRASAWWSPGSRAGRGPGRPIRAAHGDAARHAAGHPAHAQERGSK